MNQILKDLSTPDLVKVLENNMLEFLTNYGHPPHRQLNSGSNLIRFSTGIFFPFLMVFAVPNSSLTKSILPSLKLSTTLLPRSCQCFGG